MNGNLSKWFYDNIYKYMKLYLAGDGGVFNNRELMETSEETFLKRINCLESFYYIADWQIPIIPKFKSFMLDSGAFTFMQNKKIKLDFEKYTYKYCEFINKNNIDLFYELDIDSVVGLKEVERLRKILERETSKKCIPVWHRSRGKQYFIDMCKSYDYVAIGGFVSKEIQQKDYKIINYLCDIAHGHKAKIHGLGFTKVNLVDYKFDSVDSTAWTYGNRGKFLYEFNGKIIVKLKMDHNPKRLKPRETAIHNFNEWLKYSEHLEKQQIYFAGTCSRDYIILSKKPL